MEEPFGDTTKKRGGQEESIFHRKKILHPETFSAAFNKIFFSSMHNTPHIFSTKRTVSPLVVRSSPRKSLMRRRAGEYPEVKGAKRIEESCQIVKTGVARNPDDFAKNSRQSGRWSRRVFFFSFLPPLHRRVFINCRGWNCS